MGLSESGADGVGGAVKASSGRLRRRVEGRKRCRMGVWLVDIVR